MKGVADFWQPPACGCSSMVERKPSKLDVRVRFPSPAPISQLRARPCSSVVEHSLGKGEVASSILAMGTVGFDFGLGGVL